MEGLELIPVLIQMMDKAAAHQVTEAASLANLIAKLITAGHDIPGMCVVTIAVVVLILVVVGAKQSADYIGRLPINTKSSRNRTKARSSHCIIQH